MKKIRLRRSLISLLACTILITSFTFPASAGFEQGTLPEVEPVWGDVDGDWEITFKDVSLLFHRIVDGDCSYAKHLDICKDGTINLLDVYCLFEEATPKFLKNAFIHSYADVWVGSFGGPSFYDCGIENIIHTNTYTGSITYTLNVSGFGSFSKTVNKCGARFSFADIGITDEEARNTPVTLLITIHCEDGDVNLSCSYDGFNIPW